MEGTTPTTDEKLNSKSPAGGTDDVNLEVVPIVDSVKNSVNWNLPAKMTKLRESVQKRKRPRRKSKKRKYPYTRNSWQQRREQRSSERAQSVRQQMFANGQPVAPYNTTQFLIEDHGDLQNIDAQLQVAQEQNPCNSLYSNKPSRARDSSFSVDSDEDYFYSSPEDEEEFLTKEFSNAYEDLHVERLSSMSKAEIIHDYLQLESKYEKTVLELKRLKRGFREESSGFVPENDRENLKVEEHDRDTDTSSKSENELAEQLRISQLENKSLKVELEELQKKNKALHSLIEKTQSSSVDSESDSSSTSSMSSHTSSCDSESDNEMNSTINSSRTQTDHNNVSDHNNENHTEANSGNFNNSLNGNMSLSEDEFVEHKKYESEK